MSDRPAAIDGFLAAAGWGDARRAPLPGDASHRRYVRLDRDGATAMLMDAPPETGEDTRPFVALADWLTARGFSAPRILAQDAEAGLLLIEDLGDDLLAVHAAAHPGEEPDLYAAAARVLAALTALPPPALPCYREQMAALTTTVFDWYAPDHRDQKAALEAAMQRAIDATLTGPDVFVHRDYHAENLLWLPGRDGPARIGLLDFQDAMTGPAEYDLASLIHDPRRAVTPAAAEAATQAFLDATGADPDTTRARIAVCSVQRSLRIIGRVFTRLCLQAGRTSYLRFVPPTWVALQRELGHPALAEVREVLDGRLPAPDAEWMERTRAQAGRFAGRDHAGPP